MDAKPESVSKIIRKYLLTMGHERISNLSDTQCEDLITTSTLNYYKRYRRDK